MAIAVFVPVRLASTRLPQKAFLTIVDKPVIEHLIERIKLAELPDLVVICTTGDPTDDPLIDVARSNSVQLFRGNKEDLLARFLQAALEYDVETIVNVDGDDLFVDPDQVDAVAELLRETNADFVECEGLPFGAAPIGIKVDALERVCELKTETDTATGWGRYFTESNLFQVETLDIEDPELRHPELRMTLDYPEDYEFFKAVFAELYQGSPIRLRDAIRLIISRPDIRAINSGLEEKYWAHFESASPPGLRSPRRDQGSVEEVVE